MFESLITGPKASELLFSKRRLLGIGTIEKMVHFSNRLMKSSSSGHVNIQYLQMYRKTTVEKFLTSVFFGAAGSKNWKSL
jgi:hypothetical protein